MLLPTELDILLEALEDGARRADRDADRSRAVDDEISVRRHERDAKMYRVAADRVRQRIAVAQGAPVHVPLSFTADQPLAAMSGLSA